MKFSEFKYERPDYEEYKVIYETLIDNLEKCQDPDSFVEVFRKIQELDKVISTESTIASIRHSINTKDEFYDKENDYWDEHYPLYNVFTSKISKICLKCPFKEDLYDSIPKVYFQLLECFDKSFDEKAVPLFQEENRLTSKYEKLKAGAEISFNGETYNLSTISPLTESLDRDIRKGASDAVLKFYEEHEKEFDNIYDELVKLRTRIAKELGYSTYTELGYLRMQRLDYDAEMVAGYREQILKDLVPYTVELYKRQAERLGIPSITYYDKNMDFKDGNPTPKGEYDDLIRAAEKMYHEMSPETGEFIDVMVNGELFDLKSRDGKQMGGYCTSIPQYKVPFIFANFNGTSADVDVLTHEAGHAFQYYMSKDIEITDLQWPTMESAEIASMSMEFNAWPWMELFFREDTDKYKYHHLSSAVKFLPYGILIDHFQHEVYAHPEMTSEERKACFRKLEKMYLPAIDYSESPFLEKGTWWYRQGHVFGMPFYYIDYTLAQVCALQFWVRNYNKDETAWRDYVNLVSLGGTKSFAGLLEAGNLSLPFNDGSIKDIVKDVSEYLDGINDKAL